MRGLLLSAYHAQSHRQWCQAIESMFSTWEWTQLSLPARHFSWRVRGNPLHWSISERATLEQPYDLLLATSMVDFATLRGLVPSLASVPSILYFHENQFAYPQKAGQSSLLEAQMVSLYSALAADRLVFNSDYNRATFLDGCRELLSRLPDFVPSSVVPELTERSRVIPVPLAVATRQGQGAALYSPGDAYPERPLRLLWVGRFEYDKGGDRLLRFLQRLERTSINYEVAMLGQQFRNSPEAFTKIKQGFGHRLVQFGYVAQTQDYHDWLHAADIVVSTAEHEFQGLAVLEAVISGCLPLVPDRLVYPELYTEQFRYASSAVDDDNEAQAAVSRLLELAHDLEAGDMQLPPLSEFGHDVLQASYAGLFEELTG